ncbi:hypothetical protein OJF2_74900 [Aquisphaera giovannonii]|uniref:DUF2961 domain-containing protein n=1 Tax=Aquisphaera giovannonii TaxID=406548 RepID=A0A5B9WGB1_9BACT|nr:DUF2961 domain-containing protein [Aquisphaera giovannonii]QEH38880.1 hypothetical protein OJF2_74900 [Aquisphaera giovannonii]
MARDDAFLRIRPARVAPAMIVLLLSGLPARAADGRITVESLLRRMADTRWLSSPPAAGERTVQFSSYDRATRLEDGRIVNPFANRDGGHYVRIEGDRDNREYVMAEAQGPGYVSLIWTATQGGELRITVDGAATPALAAPFTPLTEGRIAPFTAPFGHESAMGRNLYFPFPFAKSIKISTTVPYACYHVAVTTFAPGTEVESYSPDVLRRAAPAIEEVRKALLNPESTILDTGRAWKDTLTPAVRAGAEAGTGQVGHGAIRSISANVSGEDVEEVLAKTLLTIAFDGAAEPQVAVPLGDFFGSGPGVNPFRSLISSVREDGTMTARWYMPYRESATVKVRCFTTKAARITLEVQGDVEDPPPGALTLYARWLQRDDIPTKREDGTLDWPCLRVSGAPGRFVGLQLNIYNPVSAWWGEGDEKVYVDGEAFPSTFGTGTEDYFGYAWCSPQLYANAFHAQTRCDGPGNKGNSSEVRYHVLDAIPFHSSLAFDMELWHWEAVRVQFATLAYFYAGAAAKVEPGIPDLSTRRVHPKPPIYREPGALEGEALKVRSRTAGDVSNQPTHAFGDGWSGEDQLWWRPREDGAELELELPVERAGAYAISAAFTMAPDYGRFEVTLDGRPLKWVDLYQPRREDFRTGSVPMALGTATLDAGVHVLGVRVSGKNPESRGYFFGLDWIKLAPTAR